MPPLHSPSFKVAALAAAIFAVGGGVGTINYRFQRTRLTEDLIHTAVTAAVVFDAPELHTLSGTRADIGTAGYAALKQRLRKIKAADPGVRYVYVFRAQSTPAQVVFLGDSTEPHSPDESLPGDPYPEAVTSPGLQQIIRDGQPSFEGPLRDSFGVWVTGYARTGDVVSATVSGAPMDILGVDVAANDWYRQLWLAAFRGALYTWLLLGFPIFAVLSRRRAGEQRDAIRNLSEAIEQSHSAILILDLDLRIEYANRGLSQQIGYSRRELIGREWREFLAGQGNSATAAELSATIRSGRSWEGEWINRRKDGTSYPVHGMFTPVKHHDGALACFVAFFDDVTELKRKEAELREARDLAQAGDRAKGQFLATMSHEVRTPLNGIVGFTSLLLETPLSAEQRDFVQTIRASGEALIQLTGDILDYARIESGKLKLDPIACDPRDCIEEALDLHATRATEKNIELLHRATDDVPSAIIVDGGRLRQVLVNLVGNAVKFTERGEVEVTVSLAEDSTSASDADAADPTPLRKVTLKFTIRDTGIGIAPDQQSRLFKPFSQLDESSTRRFGGAGLGLAISKNLVHLMEGAIALHSAPGEGTAVTFSIRVPVANPEPPARELGGLKLGIAMPAGPLRRELVGALTGWNATMVEADLANGLNGQEWDIALVEVCEHIAVDLSRRPEPLPGLPPDRTIAIVPISLPSELRSALRTHFRLLINRPIHYGALFALLSGSRPAPASPTGTTARFALHVLIVEDNPVNQRLIHRVLTGFGCTIAAVSDGRQALEALRQGGPFDIVLLDLHMPEMDGLSALAKIRAGDAGPDATSVWIIALTADARPEQRARGFAAGLNDYLTKPLRVTDLETAFRRYQNERAKRTS